ncbi:response regulator receiver domain-containing protein [mine drainage metagenome]|uniref:Response regulator receiver domain-containing protein n=2 Tax=mine drainage metagenome TaxID=410659 RepID=T1D4D8_9ZZZZ
MSPSENEHSEANLKGTKVLIVDDSRTVRTSAENMLKAAGCAVATAGDGFEALAKVADLNPDIIFIDVMMPRLDGYETCVLIKNNRQFSQIPIIMLSSRDGLFDIARGRICGAEQYLTKPFGREDLLSTLQHFLSKSQADRAVTTRG